MQIEKLIKLLKQAPDATESDGWDYARQHSCCPGDDWADGYNRCKRDIINLLSLKLKKHEIRNSTTIKKS